MIKRQIVFLNSIFICKFSVKKTSNDPTVDVSQYTKVCKNQLTHPQILCFGEQSKKVVQIRGRSNVTFCGLTESTYVIGDERI